MGWWVLKSIKNIWRLTSCASQFTGAEAIEQRVLETEGNIQAQESVNSENADADNLETSARTNQQTGNVHIQPNWLPALKGRFDEIVARWSQRTQVWTKSILELLNFK